MSTPRTKRVTAALAASIAFAIWPVAGHSAQLKAAFLPTCPTTNYPSSGTAKVESAIATAAAVALAGALVDAGFAAAKKAVTPDAKTAEARYLQDGLYSLVKVSGEKRGDGKAGLPTTVVSKGPTGCLVVVLAEGDDVADPNWSFPFEVDHSKAARAKTVLEKFLKVQSTPQLYFEAAQILSTDETAVTWQPVRFHVGKALNDGFFAGKSRGYQLELRLFLAGKDTAFASQTYQYPSVSIPHSEQRAEDSVLNAGTWQTLPAPIVPSGPLPNSNSIAFMPYTLEVRIVESPKPYALAAMFVEAVESQKAAAKAEVTKAIDNDARKAAEETAQTSALSAIEAYLKERVAAVAACAADQTKTPDGRFACDMALDKAEVQAQKASSACLVGKLVSCANLPKLPERPAA